MQKQFRVTQCMILRILALIDIKLRLVFVYYISKQHFLSKTVIWPFELDDILVFALFLEKHSLVSVKVNLLLWFLWTFTLEYQELAILSQRKS